MAGSHLVEGEVTFVLGSVPVHVFPVFSQQRSKRVAVRQRHFYSEAAFLRSLIWFDEIMLMTIIQFRAPFDAARVYTANALS